MDVVRCDLAQILINEQRVSQVVVLRERDGERVLPIEIGIYEALAINRHITGEEMIRPMTHDLTASIIESLGGKLLRVIVNDLIEDKSGHGTFYGLLVIEQNGREVEIDTRPSDAIALAVRTGCELFVADHVLQRVS